MPVPFLPLAQQEQFLVAHGMIDPQTLSQVDSAWLHSFNFHFLMGYARHYRNLVDENLWDGPKDFGELRTLVEAESNFATFMIPWIRRAECHLRALTVKHFCSEQGHGEGYLDYIDWTEGTSSWFERLQLKMLQDIHRHGEPYVVEHFDSAANDRGIDIPEKCNWNTRADWLALTRELPLWAAIDSFSIGTLGKFLQCCGTQPGGEEAVYKLVAMELGITVRNFNKSVESFGITRNLIFHHQRLWMRPMPKSPGLPNDLNRRYEDCEFRSAFKEAHFIALAGISKFLPKPEQEQYLDELDEFMQSRPLFALGIINPPFLRFEENPPADSSAE